MPLNSIPNSKNEKQEPGPCKRKRDEEPNENSGNTKRVRVMQGLVQVWAMLQLAFTSICPATPSKPTAAVGVEISAPSNAGLSEPAAQAPATPTATNIPQPRLPVPAQKPRKTAAQAQPVPPAASAQAQPSQAVASGPPRDEPPTNQDKPVKSTGYAMWNQDFVLKLIWLLFKFILLLHIISLFFSKCELAASFIYTSAVDGLTSATRQSQHNAPGSKSLQEALGMLVKNNQDVPTLSYEEAVTKKMPGVRWD